MIRRGMWSLMIFGRSIGFITKITSWIIRRKGGSCSMWSSKVRRREGAITYELRRLQAFLTLRPGSKFHDRVLKLPQKWTIPCLLYSKEYQWSECSAEREKFLAAWRFRTQVLFCSTTIWGMQWRWRDECKDLPNKTFTQRSNNMRMHTMTLQASEFEAGRTSLVWLQDATFALS